MSKFTIIDGDFTKQDFTVQSALLSLEDLSGRQRTYHLDSDLAPVKIKALKKNKVTFVVIFKDGKKFTAQADMAAYKEFMTKSNQPIMSETKAVSIFVIGIIIIGLFLKSWIGENDIQKVTQPPNSQSQIAQPILAPDVEYFAILESEIINIDSTDISISVKDGPGVLAGIDRVKTWAKLYDERKKYNVTDPDRTKIINAFKDKVSSHQKKLFPRLREVHGKIMKENAWEQDIDVQVYGKGERMLKFTGNTFVRNANIKAFMDATYHAIEPLRYKRISFRWDKNYGEETFYDLSPPDDDELVQ